MKMFIAKKRYVFKHKFLICYLILFAFFLLLINWLVKIPSIETVYLDSLYSDSYLLSENDFYYNVYGFKMEESVSVSSNSNLKEFVVNSNPIVYLYNTYQTDKYTNRYYNTYSINPVVTQANYILKEYLGYLEINALVEEESVAKVLKENDISYTLSYKGSRILLESRKQENVSLNYFFDIGISDDDLTIEINGVGYAKILFVVGNENSNYLDNYEFASILNDELNKLNSDLSEGVLIDKGLYNQDFSPNCLLIYIGCKENSIDEVNRSIKVLAQAFNNYLEGL